MVFFSHPFESGVVGVGRDDGELGDGDLIGQIRTGAVCHVDVPPQKRRPVRRKPTKKMPELPRDITPGLGSTGLVEAPHR
jgi:hypothetical protein